MKTKVIIALAFLLTSVPLVAMSETLQVIPTYGEGCERKSLTTEETQFLGVLYPNVKIIQVSVTKSALNYDCSNVAITVIKKDGSVVTDAASVTLAEKWPLSQTLKIMLDEVK